MEGRSGLLTGLQNCYTVVFKHVQECRLSGIVKTEEQQLCVLVSQAERGEKVEDCVDLSASCAFGGVVARMGYVEVEDGYIHLQAFSVQSFA